MELPIVLEGNRRDGYTVICPALPGCVSEGDTREEAIKNIQEAMRLYLRAVTREHMVLKKYSYLDFVEDAVFLVDRDGFFAGVLDRLKSRLKELGSVRRRMGKIRYWELKPDYQPGEIFEL